MEVGEPGFPKNGNGRELRLRIREELKTVRVVQRGAYTFVEVDWGTYTGFGFSKYNPNDARSGKASLQYSKEMGELKAKNKAITDILQQMVLVNRMEYGLSCLSEIGRKEVIVDLWKEIY